MTGQQPWKRLAVCPGTPLEWWYPEDEYGRGLDHVVPVEAAELCARCPVRKACDDHALHHELFGVWAGLDEVTRRWRRRNAGIRLRADRSDQIAIERAARIAAEAADDVDDMDDEDIDEWRAAP